MYNTLEEIKTKLDSFYKLERGWDSYDAEIINGKAIDLAKMIAGYTILNYGSFPFSIFPLNFDGGISFQTKDFDIEIFDEKIRIFTFIPTRKKTIVEEEKIKSIKDLDALFVSLEYFFSVLKLTERKKKNQIVEVEE